ncbi:MAG: thermonuclease family protein [Bacillus cereus]|jgi:endonuclease YncB( thermonuclease family)|nr:thermonuclease family protein [Bacillus cereus]
MKKVLFILLLLLVSCSPTSTGEKEEGIITGKVISVADGDTVTILTDTNEQIRVRLYGIDAPERGQDFGSKARSYLNSLCYGKMARVEKKGIDQYDRVLGIVYVNDLNLNWEMVKNGLAWYYDYFTDDPYLEELERVARKQKLNIWSMENPVPPYKFRKHRLSFSLPTSQILLSFFLTRNTVHESRR